MDTVTAPIEPPGADVLRGRSYAEYAVDAIRDRLIVLDLAPGTPINDERLGHELGIGRTPVREALKRLEQEHLVTVYPRRGTFVSPVDLTDLGAVTEIRERLEPLAAERAARYASPEARAAMLALADELEALDLERTSAADLLHHDLEVHRSVYAANGNAHLEADLRKYGNLATRIWCAVSDRLGDVSEHVAEHVRLLRTIAAGDAAAAGALTAEHVASFERLVRAAV